MGECAPDQGHAITVFYQCPADALHPLIVTEIIGDGKNQMQGSRQVGYFGAKLREKKDESLMV